MSGPHSPLETNSSQDSSDSNKPQDFRKVPMRTRPYYVRSMVMAILAVLSLTLPATAQLAVRAPIRIDNFAKVNDGYYRGAQPAGSDYAALARLGVKTVINL